MRPSIDKRPASESKWILVLGILIGAVIVSLLPILPAHPPCRAVYEERMRYAQEPQVSPEQAEAIRVWARSDVCPRCNGTGKGSVFQYIENNYLR
jgi:hypothetical protein